MADENGMDGVQDVQTSLDSKFNAGREAAVR